MKNIETFGEWSTDLQLWKAVKSGDEKAFTFLFEIYHKVLYNYGYKLTSDVALLEDAIQDVFIDVWRLRANLSDEIGSIKFYLFRALRRRVHKATEKSLLSEELSSLADEDILSLSFSDSETILIESESQTLRIARTKELLLALPIRQVEAITLRYYEEFSIAEISEIMNVSSKSVRNFIYKALTTMRQASNIFSSILVVVGLNSSF